MIISGEYLNGEKNGIIREYDKNKGTITFEGEYIKGKRNGRGQEFKYLKNDNHTIFEGEFLNNKRWNGKGKEYGDNDIL